MDRCVEWNHHRKLSVEKDIVAVVMVPGLISLPDILDNHYLF